MRAVCTLMVKGTFEHGSMRTGIKLQSGVGPADLFGFFGASYLGLRSSDSLQPRLSNYGSSAPMLPVRQFISIFGRRLERKSQRCEAISCF